MKYLFLISFVSFVGLIGLSQKLDTTFDKHLFQKSVFDKGDIIVGASIADQGREYNVFTRVFLAEKILFKGDVVSFDYSFGYNFDKGRFYGPSSLIVNNLLWFRGGLTNQLGYKILGATLLSFVSFASVFIPEGLTYSQNLFPKRVQANISLKPIQSVFYRDDENKIFSNAYSTTELSLDISTWKHQLIISPFYSLGKEWNRRDYHSHFGFRLGMYIKR